ncbi:MAG: phospholipid carrier-dependent glycosyltransferase [Nocardioides sp.]
MTITPVPPRRRIGLSRTADDQPVPLAVKRAALPWRDLDPFWGWFGPLLVTGLALFLRLWHLAKPHAFSFDETYYAKDAWSLLHFGYVRRYVKGADDAILAGNTTGQWETDPSVIVHPEVGKWLIALGEKAFGMDPFGWRVAAAVAGSLMVLVMCRLARRLTGSTALGCVAGLLLALDGMHLVLSRLALLDIFLALFLLCGVHCVVADREWHRIRLAQQATVGASPRIGSVRAVLVRPWLLLAGISFGLAVGTKWTALIPLAAFGLLTWAWSAGARRSLGVRLAWAKAAVVDGLPAFVQLIGVALVVYVATWGGWLAHASVYEDKLSNTQYTRYDGGEQWPTATEPDASGWGEVTQSLRSLAYYHADIWVFHTHFLNDAKHSYGSKPRGWLLLNRPVGISYEGDIQPGEQGCQAPAGSDCLRQVLLLGTPILWWGGALALLFALTQWLGARDWRYGLCVVGVAATWLPWFRYDDRPIFISYAIAILPFTVLALTLTMGRLIGAGRPRITALGIRGRSPVGVIVAGSFFMLVLMNFIWFWPIWTAELITHQEWSARVWFARWI